MVGRVSRGGGGRVGAGERAAVGAAPPARPPACRAPLPMRQVWLVGCPHACSTAITLFASLFFLYSYCSFLATTPPWGVRCASNGQGGPPISTDGDGNGQPLSVPRKPEYPGGGWVPTASAPHDAPSQNSRRTVPHMTSRRRPPPLNAGSAPARRFLPPEKQQPHGPDLLLRLETRSRSIARSGEGKP